MTAMLDASGARPGRTPDRRPERSQSLAATLAAVALQLRNLQTMVEIGVDKNSTIMFPAPLMSTIQELGAFLSRETEAARAAAPATTIPDHPSPTPADANGARMAA